MDNLFEIIVPVIFAAIYFFGNMFSKKADDDEAPNPHRSSDEDADAIERQRRIQEDIRRKIMERRREAENGAPSSNSAPYQSQPAESNAEKNYRERRAAVEQRRQQRDQEKRASRDRHTADRQLQRPLESRIPQPEFHVDSSYETEMQAKLRQIEATKRTAKKLKKQAGLASKHTSPESAFSQSRRKRPMGSVRSTLRDPAAARAAFIYGEVLGPPVTQRKNPTVPGLS